jgi:hypothetical protein
VSFATDVTINGHGVAYQVEAFYRDTGLAYTWATVAHTYSNVDYEPRIVSVGRLQRGLTNDHNLAASSVEVVLDNTDGLMDWLVNRDTSESNVFKIEFRLYAVSYNPATPGTISRKQLGTFGMLDWPRRSPKTVTLMLVDSVMIDGAELALPPSLRDWVTLATSTPSNNPLCKSASTLIDDPTFYTPYTAPLQLAFGNVTVDLQKTADGDLPTTNSNFDRRALVLCVTTDGQSVPTANDVETLFLKVQGTDPVSIGLNGLDVPKTFNKGRFPGTIWTPQRSDAITKDGRTWRIIWVDIHMRALLGFLVFKTTQQSGAVFVQSAVPDWLADPNHWQDLYGILGFAASGFPYSSRTYPSTTIPSFGTGVRAPEIAYDLLAYYSHGLTTADVDLTSFQKAAQMLPGFFASGVINDMAEIGTTRDPTQLGFNPLISNNSFVTAEAAGGRLKQVLADLCRSGSFDIFASWGGVFTATAQTSSFADQLAAATLVELDETLIVDGDWEDRVPSAGERWAPHNQMYLDGVNGRIGPFNNEAAITAWGRKLPVTLSTKWVAPADYALIAANPNLSLFNIAAVESKARQRVKFVYGSLDALQFDLGSYFKLSLKRGLVLNPVFSSAVFKVEQIDLLPSMGVYIEAIWFDDLTSDRPYFLDDETYSIVVQAAGGRTATVTDGSATVSFSSGDLFADGVTNSDILVLKDVTQGNGVYSRYRALRIAGVDDVGLLHVSSADLNFGSALGTAVGQWEIHRGAVTYSFLTSSDPTHYPTSGYPPLYGKVTDSTGVFSNSSAGNKLLDG